MYPKKQDIRKETWIFLEETELSFSSIRQSLKADASPVAVGSFADRCIDRANACSEFSRSPRAWKQSVTSFEELAAFFIRWAFSGIVFRTREDDTGHELATTTTREKNRKIDEIGNVIEEAVDLTKHINLEEDSDDVQELLDSHSQELTEMYEQKQDIEQLESINPSQSEDRMTAGNLTEGLSLIEKSPTKRVFLNRTRNKKIISMIRGNLV
ncbi:hypothetical protein TNCV_1866791 [Trichonephila clavipes]|nr:hypothetical protein TNCV_1866791 [Trichonephila clavipes]